MPTPQDAPPQSSRRPAIPMLYRTVFLYLEPLSTLVGAVYAHCFQPSYLQGSDPASAPLALPIPLSTSIVLSQLANLYLLLCINEALVLRATDDAKIWKTFMVALLIADLGHLYTVHPLGHWVYWRFWQWNPMDWGNVGFVYFLALIRALLFAGVGFDDGARLKKA